MVEQVTLYRAPTTVADADAIAKWLEPRIDATVTVEDRFLAQIVDDELALSFAEARVLSPYDRTTGNTMLGIRRYEERALEQPDRAGGVLYDGQAVQRACNRRLPADEVTLEHLHVPLIDRALGTWGDHDGRWHKRICVLGQPALISVPGLYEAPAKPEAYYQEQQRHAMLSGDTPPREILEDRVEGQFLVEDDPRTTDCLKGYALAAVHYLETGEAFCPAEGCRLFNAHYHKDLIEAQQGDPAFCVDHAPMYDG
ncbi:MAG: DUF6775 family putative metallopeptidase [Natrialbaceae archaeon]|nr:DUF6775 family putative metallopeptidase [Natrialbaceae archaeon]